MAGPLATNSDPMALTLALGRFVADLRFDALPAGSLHWVGTAFADTVGTLVAGRNEPATLRLLKAALG